MLFRSLIFAVVSLLLFARYGWAHGYKPLKPLDIEDVTFNPQFLQIGPKPNFVKVTVKLIGSPYMRPPHTLLVKKIRSLPNGKAEESTVSALQDNGKGQDKKARDGIYSGVAIIQQKTSDEVKFRVVAEHHGVLAASEVFTRLAGSTFKPGKSGTVQGADGITVTIPADSIPYEAQVAILPANPADIKAPVDDTTPVIVTVKLIVEPVQPGLEVTPLQKPLQISFPTPNNLSTSNLILTKEIEVPLPGTGNDEGGFFNRLTPVDTAVLDSKSNRIVTETTFYGGILGSGLYALLANFGSDNIQGHVCEGTSLQTPCSGAKVPAVVVANNTNTLVAVTDAQGLFQLFISGAGQYDLTAFDSMRGFSGEASYTLPAQTQDTDVALSKKFTLLGYKSALTGIRNGGFECVKTITDPNTQIIKDTFCDGYWGFDTAGLVDLVQSVPLCNVPSSGSTAPDTTCPASNSQKVGDIKPNEGKWMARITTGIKGIGEVGSVLTQLFTLPKGATNLYFDYIFLSEEFNEFVNTQFDDTFRATVTPSSTGIPEDIKVVSINNPGVGDLVPCTNRDGQAANCLPEDAIFNCGFLGGDGTCGKIPFVKGNRNATVSKWATASIDLSKYAGQPITLDLTFTTTDKGDDVYDTQVLLDNIRFNTVFLDVNAVQEVITVQGVNTVQVVLPGSRTDCTSPLSCVQNDLFGFDNTGTRRYGANEILSQAGLNLRLLRDAQGNEIVDTISLTGGGTTLIAKENGAVTSEASAMLTRNNSSLTAQVYYAGNIKYRRTINGNISYTAAQGIAFTAEDDHLARFTNDGVAVSTGVVSGCVLGGHILAHELGHLLLTTGVFDSPIEHDSSGTFMTGTTACELPANGGWKIVNSEQQNGLNKSLYRFIEQ